MTVTNPGNQTGTVGTAVSLQIHATDSASGQTLTYSATGLPAGLSINSSTGLISGTPTTARHLLGHRDGDRYDQRIGIGQLHLDDQLQSAGAPHRNCCATRASSPVTPSGVPPRP